MSLRAVLLCCALLSTALPVAAQEAAAGELGLHLRVFGGAGIGTRGLDWPARGERFAVRTGAFAALDVGGSFSLVTSKRFSIGPALAYQTSVGSEITEQHIAGESDTLGIRAHRFEAMLAANLRFGSSGGFRIVPAVGYALRNLRPAVHHLLTPSYTLAGPLLRISVRIPFGERVAVRLAPELQWIVVGDELEELGMSSSGFGYGGELALELRLLRKLSLELSVRDARASVASAYGSDSVDRELFATARLVWQP